MWGDHLLASLSSPHHISAPVRTGLAFLFLCLPRNDTISWMLWMIRRHIFLYRRVCCECSFCQHHSGFCNYSTDRLKSWISVNAMSYIHFFKRKLKERKLLCKLRCLRRISRPEKSRNSPYNITIIFYTSSISPISCVRLINEWQSIDRSQSRVACRDFLGLWLLKKFVFLKESVVQNFLKAEVKQNTKTKTEG